LDIYTIGFTKKSAANFFNTLRENRIRRLLDVRINNTSQLAGYTKQDDLAFFLREIGGMEYVHLTSLAPTRELLKEYRDKKISWASYEERFLQLLEDRAVEDSLDAHLFDVATVLLCTEPTPEMCHRRLVLEYLDSRWGGVTAIHL